MIPSKPYSQIPIQDCDEPLVAISLEKFAVLQPHPYEKLGANYDGKSPYCLRQGVLNALLEAQNYLQQTQPRWKMQIFDAYRPIAVQQFMVDYTFASLLAEQSLSREALSIEQSEAIYQKVYHIWAIPSRDRATPPPHSTGAAVDLTLVDETGNPLDMGGEIDELSARSHPDYYADRSDSQSQQYHARRQLLDEMMQKAGFYRHPGEWWHFSWGDQMWAWQYNLDHPHQQAIARYGRVE